MSMAHDDSWFTMNGTHVHCPDGMSKAEAGKQFVIKKQAQRLRKKDEEKQRQQEWQRKADADTKKRDNELTRTIQNLKKNDPFAYMRVLAKYAPKEYKKIMKRLGG